MGRRAYTLLLTLACCLGAAAQGRFAADEQMVNVGEIMFQTARKVTFGFRNTGNKPLTITSVHPSCGCVAVEYPKRAIKPGEKGEITATYDATMLGVFVKELEVHTDAGAEPVYLTMQGKVTTNPVNAAQDFPINLDNVRLTTNTIEFDDVNKGDYPVAELHILNCHRQAYQPELMHLPPYLSAEYEPLLIPGGRTGKVRLTLNSAKLPAMGLTQTSIYLARYNGDKIGEDNEIAVSAVLLPDFRWQSAAANASAPCMAASSESLDLGSWGKKSALSGTIEITNTGELDLEIERLQVFNKALSVSLSKRTLRQGEKARLKVSVEKKYLKRDKNRLRVLLITNDPAHSKQIFTIKADKP